MEAMVRSTVAAAAAASHLDACLSSGQLCCSFITFCHGLGLCCGSALGIGLGLGSTLLSLGDGGEVLLQLHLCA